MDSKISKISSNPIVPAAPDEPAKTPSSTKPASPFAQDKFENHKSNPLDQMLSAGALDLGSAAVGYGVGPGAGAADLAGAAVGYGAGLDAASPAAGLASAAVGYGAGLDTVSVAADLGSAAVGYGVGAAEPGVSSKGKLPSGE